MIICFIVKCQAHNSDYRNNKLRQVIPPSAWESCKLKVYFFYSTQPLMFHSLLLLSNKASTCSTHCA